MASKERMRPHVLKSSELIRPLRSSQTSVNIWNPFEITNICNQYLQSSEIMCALLPCCLHARTQLADHWGLETNNALLNLLLLLLLDSIEHIMTSFEDAKIWLGGDGQHLWHDETHYWASIMHVKSSEASHASVIRWNNLNACACHWTYASEWTVWNEERRW